MLRLMHIAWEHALVATAGAYSSLLLRRAVRHQRRAAEVAARAERAAEWALRKFTTYGS